MRAFRIRGVAAAGLMAAGAAMLAGGPVAAQPAPEQMTLNCIGGSQSWTVPAGVTEISIVVDGAAGGDNNFGSAGRGGRTALDAPLTVTPGEELTIEVGCAGDRFSLLGGYGFGHGGNGGPGFSDDNDDFNDGIDGASGGGGSAVLRGETVLMVAGGGGGASPAGGSSDPHGGHGGAPGGAGGTAPGSGSGGGGDGGGTAAPGAGGTANGSAGSGHNGGAGGAGTPLLSNGGGGGGGGWFGGGGGGGGIDLTALGGGGGGGSSYLAPELDGQMTTGVREGNGAVTITYSAPADPSPVDIDITWSPTDPTDGDDIAVTVDVTSQDPTAGDPTGDVELSLDGSVIDTATLNSPASFTLTGLTDGTYDLQATYLGDGTFAGATSSVFTLTVAAQDDTSTTTTTTTTIATTTTAGSTPTTTAPAGTTSELPRTGTGNNALGATGAVLVAFGVALVVFDSRRNRYQPRHLAD